MTPSIKKKLFKLVKMLLGEGMSVEKATLSIALGFALGIFPLVGSTTVLCAIAALVLRLNLPAIQAVNYLVYPLQLVLLVPFYGAGNWLFGNRSFPAIKQNLIDLVKTDFWGGTGRALGFDDVRCNCVVDDQPLGRPDPLQADEIGNSQHCRLR